MDNPLQSPEEIQYAIDQVKANLAISGLYATPEDEKLWRDYLEGKLTLEEAFEEAGRQLRKDQP